MNEEVINALADALNQSYDYIAGVEDPMTKENFAAQLRDDTIAVANVIFKYKHAPHYTMDMFYDRAGYAGTHPIHDFDKPHVLQYARITAGLEEYRG